MGQYWLLLNYDLGETLSNLGKLNVGMFESPFEALVPMLKAQEPVTLLAEPQDFYWRMLRRMAKEFGWKRRTRRAIPIGANVPVFDRLPAEIILMILNEMIEDCVDCICLGLCNQRLWSIARGVIMKCLREIDAFNSWAGGRLICVGDYTEPNDLPPEIPFDEYRTDFTDGQDYVHTMYEVADETWPVADYGNSHRHMFIERGLKARGLDFWNIDMDLWKALKGPEFCYSYDDLPSSDNPFLLRNLTTHEGVWAAHRFDIVPATELEKMEKDEKMWKDVNKEVMDEMEDIWSWWLLLNLDAGETSSWPGTFREFMLNKPSFLVEMLDVNKVTLLEEPATYYWEELKRLTKRSGRKRSRRGILNIRVPVSAFDRLPAEIICMIANELTEDCIDCVCFGLTNRRHWSIARGVIEKCLHNIAYLNSYAGDRLMFAGSWMDHDDLPPGIFDEQDLDDLTNEEGYMQHLFLVAEDWPRTKTEAFTHRFVDEGLRSRSVGYRCADLYLWVALQGPEFRGRGDYDRHYPSPDNFRILRNLTTNEYVHESTLFEWTEKKGVPQSPDSLYRVNLGHICAV
ncbi:hypothetical protein EWM64_g10173 [Hericium alpestre]|uniref:F-box domain-containing protein n=1 Tax=Hericium alpestre TaxID=135208 RepID=A0A4Y9ZK77_9AGAM|nr:hypothetical protein EWM64_g10173 [Hericium alpestre]